jgi:hypothetical protein
MLNGLLAAQALDATQANVSHGARLCLDRPMSDNRCCCMVERSRAWRLGNGSGGSLGVSPPGGHRYVVREGVSDSYGVDLSLW